MDISSICAGVPIRAGGWLAPLWQHLHHRRRPAPAATAAVQASLKNAAMVPPGVRRDPACGRYLRRCGRPASTVRQAAAAPLRRERRLGGGRRAPENGCREAETALRAGRSCAGASTAWGGWAADGELRLPGVTRGGGDAQEESGSRAAAAGGSAALWRTGGAAETMRRRCFSLFLSERCESRELAGRERVNWTAGPN